MLFKGNEAGAREETKAGVKNERRIDTVPRWDTIEFVSILRNVDSVG